MTPRTDQDVAASSAPWVRTVSWEEATGVLREAYDWQAAKVGAPTEFTQLGSLAPELVLQRLQLYRVVEGVASQLTVIERRVAAFVTSIANHTPHCASGLRIQLDDLGVDPDVITRAEQSPEHLGSGDDRLDEIAAHSSLLATQPWLITAEHIDRLRTLGLDDLDIVDLNNIVAYYAYINRVATGLGLRSEIPPTHARGAVPE